MIIVKKERGQALLLVLILLVVGTLVTVPALQLVETNLRARMNFEEFIKEDYAAEAAQEYALWKLRWDPTFAPSLAFGVPSPPLLVTINGVTANATVTAEASDVMSGFALIDHQIKPTKEVTPTTAVPNVPTTFTYTITLERLEPDDAVFNPLQSVIDGLDAGFVYVPNSSELDGVPFNDNDLTILEQPVIVSTLSSTSWSDIAVEDAMVRQDAPAQNYGANLTMKVSSGLPSANITDRSFVKFDITGLSIPAGAVLQSAILRLWAESYPGTTRTYDLHLVTDNWTEGSINWNNQPAVVAAVSSSNTVPSDIGTPMEWNVTADVQDYLSSNTTIIGWRINDDAEEIGTGNYTAAVSDTLEFDAQKGKTPVIIPISGDVYAIAYTGDGDDGFLKTVEIASSGNITDTVIDTLEFDTLKGNTPNIIPVNGNVYAIAYEDNDGYGSLKTVEITSSGNITDTVIDTLNFDAVKGKTPDIIPVSGDVYAIAYEGDSGGSLKTVRIAADGQITNTVIDTLVFDTLKGVEPDIIPISGDIYAIAYEDDDGYGSLKTVQIASSGQITNAVIDTLKFDTVKGKTPSITPVSGDVYAIAYAGDGDDAYLKIVDIQSDGNISDALINNPEFDIKNGKTPDIIPISGDVIAVAYSGDGDDGFLKTVDILTGNNIEYVTVFDTKEDDDPGGTEPVLVVEYVLLGGSEYQTIEWIFEPDLDFYYGQERTLSFEARASLPDDTIWWNVAQIYPNEEYTGMTANVTVGNPPDTGIPGAGVTLDKSVDPLIVYAGIPTVVTYVISITNSDNVSFDKLDKIKDYLPEGFLLIEGSSVAEWPDHNSLENDRPGYPLNNGNFEPKVTMSSDNRQILEWHNKDGITGEAIDPAIALHDYSIAPGVTYTLTFQVLATVEVSGNYPNEVFTKLKDNLFDRGLNPDDMIYSWPTGEVVVPAYDILTATEHSTLRSNAAITQAGIILRSWHWKKHK